MAVDSAHLAGDHPVCSAHIPSVCSPTSPHAHGPGRGNGQLARAAAGGRAPGIQGATSGGVPHNLTQLRPSTEAVSRPLTEELSEHRLRGVRGSGSMPGQAPRPPAPLKGAGVRGRVPQPCMPRAAPDTPGHPCWRDAEGTLWLLRTAGTLATTPRCSLSTAPGGHASLISQQRVRSCWRDVHLLVAINIRMK